jgi:hypothetical protein
MQWSDWSSDVCSSDLVNTLTSLTFEEDSALTVIGPVAFHSCSISAVRIPRNVIVLSERCFSHCLQLETLEFENGSALQEIQAASFEESRLRNVALLRGGVSVAPDAFPLETVLERPDEEGTVA